MSETEKCDINPDNFTLFRTIRDSSVSKEGVDVLRCDIQDGNDAKLWVEEYAKITKTEWIVERSVVRPRRSEFCKWWCCQHASKNKKPDYNTRGKNTNCKARINVTIKKTTPNVVLRDAFLQGAEPLRGVVKIQAEHNHPINSGDSMRILRASRHIRLMFEDYFSRGLPPSSAKRLHESKLSMEENASDLLADLSVNPQERTVQYWYTSWRKLDYKMQVDSSCEAATSAKAAMLWEAMEASGLDGSETDFDPTWQEQDDEYDKEEHETEEIASAVEKLECEKENAAVVAAEEEIHEKKPLPTSHLYFELTKPLNNSVPTSSVRLPALPTDQPSTAGTAGKHLNSLSFTTSSSSIERLPQVCNTVTQCATITTPTVEKHLQTPPVAPNFHLVLSSNPVVDKLPPTFTVNSHSQTKLSDKNVQSPDTPLYHLIINPQSPEKPLQVSKSLDCRPTLLGGSTLSLAGNNVTSLSKAADLHTSAGNLEIKCLPPLILHAEKSIIKPQTLPEITGMDKLLRMPTDVKSTPPNSSAGGVLPLPPTSSATKAAGLQNLLLVQFPPTMLPPPQPPVQKGQPPQPQLILLQSPVPPTPLAPGHVPKTLAQSQPRLILFQMPQASVQPSIITGKTARPCGSKPQTASTSSNAEPKPQQTLPVPPLVSINRIAQSPGPSDSRTSPAAPLMFATSASSPHFMNAPIFQITSGEQQCSAISSKSTRPPDLQRLDADQTVLIPDASSNSARPSLDLLSLVTAGASNTSLQAVPQFSSDSINTVQKNPTISVQLRADTVTSVAQPQPDNDIERITSELVRIQKLCENHATFRKTAPRIVQCLKKIHTPVQAANALLRMNASLAAATRSCDGRSAITHAVRHSCRTARRKWLTANRKHKDRRKKRCNS